VKSLSLPFQTIVGAQVEMEKGMDDPGERKETNA
jgi:hypothetical protein